MKAKTYKSIQEAIDNGAYSYAPLDRTIENLDGSITFVYKK